MTRPCNDALLAWYRTHRRDLPWRSTTDPYRILVSEVMLQQTQAERVVPRYLRFVERFPTVRALAEARLRDVLEEWEGLGYPNRARRLWETARIVTDSGWPGDAEGLQRLPGIGPYTAAALGSLAFGRREAAVDTNLRRVLSRWEGRALDGKDLWNTASTLVPDASADWNQALMDLGATTCHPRVPGCGDCPVARWCAGPLPVPPPSRQARFEGSHRQVRGAVLRHLRDVPAATVDALCGALPHDAGRIEAALRSLEADGLVAVDQGEARLGG